MLVIFIGPDKAGKSTTINAVARHYDQYIHKATHLDNAFKTAEAVLDYLYQLELSKATHGLILWDRWYYPDDLIYSPVVVGQPSVLYPMEKDIEKQLLKYNPVFVYIDAQVTELVKRFRNDDDEDYITTEQYVDIIGNYQTFLRRTTIPVIKVDTSVLNKDAAARYVIDELNKRLLAEEQD